jgi:C-terminal processing protease CtpA/Prc
MDCIEGGPADRAGIGEGDELVEIDGILLALPLSCLLIVQ